MTRSKAINNIKVNYLIGSQGVTLTRYLGSGYPNTLLAGSTSDSTVLDNLSINGLLAQYVQKAGRLPFGYPTGLLAKIAHTFLSQVILHSKLDIKQKLGTDNRVFLQSVLNFLCVSDVEFILCIGYLFCPYPHRSKAFNILVSIQSAFNIGTDIFVVCISGYRIVPTFIGGFIEG